MKVLQIGVAKSGNFWIYEIIQNILTRAKIPIYRNNQRLKNYDQVKNLQLSTKEQQEVDVIDIDDDGVYSRISSIIKEPITDFDHYINHVTHVWSHSAVSDNTDKVITHFDKVVYIIRDPRDVLFSMSNFMLKPYMKKYYPNEYNSADEYVNDKLEPFSRLWFRHVSGYLEKNYSNVYFVFYERLLHDFEQELESLVNFLGLKLSPDDLKQIEKESQAAQMIDKNPNHVNIPSLYRWKNKLNNDDNEKMLETLYYLLKIFNYNLYFNEPQSLPKLHEKVFDDITEIKSRVIFLLSIHEQSEMKNYTFSKQFNTFYDQILQIKKKYQKVLIYGAGKTGNTMYLMLKECALALLDQSSNQEYMPDFLGKQVCKLSSIKDIDFEVIVISVLGREREIVKSLFRIYNVPASKILLVDL